VNAAERPRILVVEDDAEFSDLLSRSLVTGGFAVDVVHTVRDARAQLRKGEPSYDLVISDLRFPKESGIELLLGESTAGPSVPLILMTAFGSPELREFVEDMGGCLLEKPFSLELLCRRVSDILQEKRPVCARNRRDPATGAGPRPVRGAIR
jgi:DNA-binding response OmpR family regulator